MFHLSYVRVVVVVVDLWKDYIWNCLDLFIVVMGAMDQWVWIPKISLANGGTHHSIPSLSRTLAVYHDRSHQLLIVVDCRGQMLNDSSAQTNRNCNCADRKIKNPGEKSHSDLPEVSCMRVEDMLL